jgi:uncharacterized protein YktA (UPF0223 family)
MHYELRTSAPVVQALQNYQQALERNKDSKQLVEKVRVLQKVVRSKAAAAQRTQAT